MLVLARYRGEEIVFDTKSGPIIIKVVAIERNRVKIGIDAGQDVNVMRKELLDADVSTDQ